MQAEVRGAELEWRSSFLKGHKGMGPREGKRVKEENAMHDYSSSQVDLGSLLRILS